MLEIMKASAGSGKTFNLARKYITLLFKKHDVHAYRHILAVTFTNKATDEMKSRILKELFILASEPGKSGYLKYFMPERFSAEEMRGIEDSDIVTCLPGKKDTKITLESLADSAGTVLYSILHDYSAFSVSTIDRFFQQTLKAFSREIGHFSSYQVELDKHSLVEESVARVLDSLTENDRELLKWLTDSVLEQIESGGRYNLEKSLVEMASRLKSDEHRTLAEKFGIDEAMAYSKSNLSSIRKSCTEVIAGFERESASLARAALSALESARISASESNRRFMEKLYDFAETRPGTVIAAPTPSFTEKARDPEKWFPKKTAGKLLPQVRGLLEDPLSSFCALFESGRYREYNTALILKKQLYSLGITGELYREFSALLKEKNVLSIDDSNNILKGIIDDCDAPFIYEKTGVRYENFLLDEFQDTSRVQWENFLPLLRNSESQGFENLIVGDVKQSIYRWRGSDWNLFHSELHRAFSRIRETGLDTNYRSFSGIVRFNNVLFPEIAAMLDSRYRQFCPDSAGDEISRIYEGVEQKAGKSGDETGLVDILFCGRETENENVLSTVRRLLSEGVSCGEIAVLVRNNASGAEIASYLIDNDIDVITDDSLRVKSSISVRRIVALLSSEDNPDDSINAYVARSFGAPETSGAYSLYDLCECLARTVKNADTETFGSEILYVQSFMDYVQDYAASNGNDLHDFLTVWADADPCISSPAVSDAVRVMTIHKSKGLDFPYVIFPYTENVTLYKAGKHWCVPDFSGMRLDCGEKALYDVTLSSRSLSTLFDKDYLAELKLQYVDNINTFYVALTRAVRGMFLISAMPSATFRKSMESGEPEFSDFSEMLYWFSARHSSGDGALLETGECAQGCMRFVSGALSGGLRSDAAPDSLNDSDTRVRYAGYPSWSLNGGMGEGLVPGKGRLKFSTDSAEFFHEDGKAGMMASRRLRGVVLHDILAGVVRPSDLGRAVETALLSGDLDRQEADLAYDLLSSRIGSAVSRGWFPDDAFCVHTEVTLIDTDGSLFRPDRVIEKDGCITVVDYKFGEPRAAYTRQIEGYADIYRRMGYDRVSTAIWYVLTDEVVYSGV